MNRRNAVAVAAAGLVGKRAPAAAQAQETTQRVQRFTPADAEGAEMVLNTLINGGEGCGRCAFHIDTFSLTPNDTGYDLIVVTTGGLS